VAPDRRGRTMGASCSTTTPAFGGQATLTKMMAVPITLRPTFTVGTPRQLFEGRYGATAVIRSYDVTADGRRFLMVQQQERPAVTAAEMVLVQNWIEELKARVPVDSARSWRSESDRLSNH
jgi:hypothetical protein